jgi:hypothetical protein
MSNATLNFNSNTADFDKKFDFDEGSMTLLGSTMDRGQPIPIVAYTNDWKGKKKFHIRTLWSQGDDDLVWNPGKGISVPVEQAAALCAAIGKLAQPAAVEQPAAKSTRKLRTA